MEYVCVVRWKNADFVGVFESVHSARCAIFAELTGGDGYNGRGDCAMKMVYGENPEFSFCMVRINCVNQGVVRRL